MCWQLCAVFSFPPNWQLGKLDSIFYQLQHRCYTISHSQGCQFLSSNLEKDSFSGKIMTCEPCIHVSHLSLLSFPEWAVFSYVPCQGDEDRSLLLMVNLWQNSEVWTWSQNSALPFTLTLLRSPKPALHTVCFTATSQDHCWASSMAHSHLKQEHPLWISC